MDQDPLLRAMSLQAKGFVGLGAPFYAALLDAAAADLPAAAHDLFEPWRGRSARDLFADAVLVRFLGGLNDLAIEGVDPDLSRTFEPPLDGAAAWIAARAAIQGHAPRLAAFMTHEPQTNEVARSTMLLPGFLTIAGRTGLPLRCLELGASAGLNQLWPRFRYRLGAAGAWGDPASPVRLATDWRGSPPPLSTRIELAGTAACDRKPVRLADPAEQRRLLAYVWPGQTARRDRLKAAIGLALAETTTVETADAADWVRANAAPREGVATVIFHSVFWQYLPEATARTAGAAIEAHGATASDRAPLAWLRMEPRENFADMELRLTLWPGGEERRLAEVHVHGDWIEWTGWTA